MLSFIGKRLLNPRQLFFKQDLRHFLSNAYNCQEVWEQRKQATIFQKVDFDDLYHQLDRCFQTEQRISILDVDVFLNGIQGESYQNELEDVIFKLRMNPETALMAGRIIHAVVKFYIDAGKKKELLHILSNRLIYGIFLDDYAANILMDGFLKENDVTSAAKVAVLVMLQEDFSHPITKTLALCSSYKYLKSEDVWEKPKPEEVDPDEDEVKERVRYLRNPYFDDHFDLTDPNHLVGKTLFMSGSSCPGALGTTSRLIGLILWEKYETAEELLRSGVEFLDSGVEMALAFTKNRPKSAEEGEITEQKAKIITLLEKAKTVAGDVHALAEAGVLAAVKEFESRDVQKLAEVCYKIFFQFK